MSMIANDRFPDVPMATQGQNQWANDSLGDQVETNDGVPGGHNTLTAGPNGQGMELSRARASGNGTFHHTSSNAGSSGAGYTGEQT